MMTGRGRGQATGTPNRSRSRIGHRYTNAPIHVLSAFLLPVFTRLGHGMSGSFESERWNECMHRLDLCLYSHPKKFWGNRVRTHVDSKDKIPSTGKILLRGGSNPRRCIMQDSEPNALPTSFSRLTSQQHASVSQRRIWADNYMCCRTETKAADQIFYLNQSRYTDTGPTSPSADPLKPGAWQGSHWSANF